MTTETLEKPLLVFGNLQLMERDRVLVDRGDRVLQFDFPMTPLNQFLIRLIRDAVARVPEARRVTPDDLGVSLKESISLSQTMQEHLHLLGANVFLRTIPGNGTAWYSLHLLRRAKGVA